MISLAEIEQRMDGFKLPLLTLTEFFDGNTEEESIGPNQWGFGRPPLAEIAERLQILAARKDVAWVRIELHPDSLAGDISAEGIVLCTTASTDDIDLMLNGLETDGAFHSAQKLAAVTQIPTIPTGYTVQFVVWD